MEVYSDTRRSPVRRRNGGWMRLYGNRWILIQYPLHHHYVPSVVNRSAVMDLHRSRSCATLIQSAIPAISQLTHERLMPLWVGKSDWCVTKIRKFVGIWKYLAKDLPYLISIVRPIQKWITQDVV